MNHNRQKGKLNRWNDDKGFGFVGSEGGKRDVFIHISELKKMSRRPVVGDVITYLVQTDNDGKQRAVKARIEGVAEINSKPGQKYVKQKKGNNWISGTLSVVLVVGIGFAVFVKYVKNSDLQGKATTSKSSYTIEEQNAGRYRCAGKVYCSDMTSCDEAVFYQRNCPGTKMDGDGDGIPCESQWCSQ